MPKIVSPKLENTSSFRFHATVKAVLSTLVKKKNGNTSWQNASDEEQELSREVAVSFGDRYVEILEASVLANAYMEGKLHIRILKLD